MTDIVTMCGSIRFFDLMLRAAADETAAGHIVLAPFPVAAPEDRGGEFRAMLDRLHFEKIDRADRVIIVTDTAGYIGESTTREIAYAESTGKPVEFRAFEPVNAYTGEHGDPAVDRERLLECADVTAETWVSSPAARDYLEDGGYNGLIRCLDILAQVNVAVRAEAGR